MKNGYEILNKVLKHSRLLCRKIKYLTDISYLDLSDIRQELSIQIFDKEGLDINQLANLCIKHINSLLKEFKPEQALKCDVELDGVINVKEVHVNSVDEGALELITEHLSADDIDSIMGYKNLRVASKIKCINYEALAKRIYRAKRVLGDKYNEL